MNSFFEINTSAGCKVMKYQSLYKWIADNYDEHIATMVGLWAAIASVGDNYELDGHCITCIEL